MLVMIVVGMIVWRKIVSRNEDDQLHVLHAEAVPQQASVANKLDVIDKWGKLLTVITARWAWRSRPLDLPDLGPGRIHRHIRELRRHAEPGTISIGRQARFCPHCAFPRGSRRRVAGSGQRQARGMFELPRPGAKAGKERPHGPFLRYLPRIPREPTHTPPELPSPPAPPAIRTRRATMPAARTGWRARAVTRARPIAGCATGAPTNCCRPSPRVFAPPCRIPAACATPMLSEQYRSSVHGQAMARGITQAPLCTDCHGEHKIVKHTNEASPVNAAHIRDTCGSCHGDLRLSRKFGLPSDRMISFDSSFHGLAAKGGSQTVANCASCHGVHNILPSTDAKSPSTPRTCPATCGKCHPGAGTALRHQPGACCGRPQRAGGPALGSRVLPAGDSGDDRTHAAAQWRRLDPQADSRPVPRPQSVAPAPAQPAHAESACCRSSASSTRFSRPHSWCWSGQASP